MKNTANLIDFINNVNKSAEEVFRGLAAIAFQTELGLGYGNVHMQFYGDKNKARQTAFALPKGLTFGLKFVVMKGIGNGNVVGSFMLTRTDVDALPLGNIVPLAITSAIPANIKVPEDGHLRWRTSAPLIPGRLVGYLVHKDQVLIIDTKDYGLIDATDVQVTLAGGVYNITIPTGDGDVFQTRIRPFDVLTNGKITEEFRKVQTGVKTLLTVPRKNEMIALYGKNDGVYIGNNLVATTKGLNVTKLVVDSENPRIFIVTDDDKIYGLPIDGNFLPTTGKLIPISDTMRKGEQLFAGPNVIFDDKTLGILAIDWIPQNDGFNYTERTIAVPQLTPPIPNAPIPTF